MLLDTYCAVLTHSVVSDSATPWTVACQSPLSMEFSSQEYWSGLPCPSPGDLPNPGIEPRSPALQADSLPSELSAKPKNTGLGTLSLLQGIFLTQESNQGLLHCRQILYQLICQGSPLIVAIDILNTINLEVTVFIHCGICPSKD